MSKWNVNVGRGFGIGLGLMCSILLGNAALIGVAASRPVTFGTFLVGIATTLGLILVGLIAYWVYGLAGASYRLDRNALIIHWGTSQQIIPTGAIERVFTGEDIKGEVHFYGGRWPGHWVGYGELEHGGPTLFYATRPLREQIFVATPGLIYALSPARRDAFLDSLQQRVEMGPTQAVDQSTQRPRVLDWPIWRDWLGLALLGVGTLALASLLAIVSYRFPSLPALIPLHFGPSGAPDRLGPRSQLFRVPLIGLLTLILNGALGAVLYRRSRLASYLLWGATVLIQVLVWTATLAILTRV